MKKIESIIVLVLFTGFILLSLKFSLDANIVLTIILVITTIIYTRITGEILSSQNGPKLYPVGLIKSNDRWNKSVMDVFGFGGCPEYGEGFAKETNKKDLTLEIYNNGNRPATNITIKYAVIVYKSEITFGIDTADVIDVKLVKHKRVEKELKFDYIPPGGMISQLIIYVSTYPKCELEITTLKCKEEIFITKSTVVLTYKDDRYDNIASPQDYRYLLGV